MHDPMDRDSSLDDLAKPVKSVEEKWKLLPYFLLMRQHIHSFNHFTNDDYQVKTTSPPRKGSVQYMQTA